MSGSVLFNFISRSLSSVPTTIVSTKHCHYRSKANSSLLNKVLKSSFSSPPRNQTISLSAFCSSTNKKFKNEDRKSKLERTKSNLRETKRLMKVHIDGMKENVMTVPNLLCLIRIGLTPVLGYYVVNEQYIISLSIFVVAGATDLV